MHVTQDQLQQWIGLVFWPFLRIGACLMVAPMFGADTVPRRLRLLLALAITVAVLPMLPVPHITLLSADGLVTTVQQMIIGIALGFTLQLLFDALALAGQILANSMGLGFAFNIDPLRGASSPVLGQLYLILGTLTFLALDGHLALLELLTRSFQQLPVGPNGLDLERLQAVALWGSELFSGALRIALPGVTALLVVNLAFGVTSRAAPALNLFAVGLPVTLIFGLVIVLVGMPAMLNAFTLLLAETFHTLSAIAGGG
jgi:flagellar biosynthetic protein FliR